MFLQFLLSAVKGAATEELSHLLDKFRELNGAEKHDQLVATLKNSFELLQDCTDKTKTKIDDTLVSIVLNALPE